jgi:glycosyltransferase involved in cell wall biosynthesis
MGMPPLRVAAGRAGVRFAGLHDDLPQARLHEVLGTHRAYLHPYRWTSLGLALLEAMVLGMPVLALATTEAPRAVPPEAGLVTCDVAALHERAQRWLADHAAAREAGLAARAHVLGHYGLQRFLDDWDELLKEVAS